MVSGRVVKKLTMHKEPVRDVAWSPSDAVLVSGCMDGYTLEWRPKPFTDSVLSELPCNRRRFHRWYY